MPVVPAVALAAALLHLVLRPDHLRPGVQNHLADLVVLPRLLPGQLVVHVRPRHAHHLLLLLLPQREALQLQVAGLPLLLEGDCHVSQPACKLGNDRHGPGRQASKRQ